MKATFIKSEHETSDIWTFFFKPEHNLDYIAGQFIELGLELPEHSKDKPRRWFTLSSSPTEKYLTITTRINQSSSSNFKAHLCSLQKGDNVEISQAMGDFVLPKDKGLPLVFIAGGIGITPYRSIVKWLTDAGETRDIRLVHTISKDTDKIFSDIFKVYGCMVTNIDIGQKKTLGASNIRKMIEFPDQSLIYISGPETLVEHLRQDFISSGYPEYMVIGDYFPGYTRI